MRSLSATAKATGGGKRQIMRDDAQYTLGTVSVFTVAFGWLRGHAC